MNDSPKRVLILNKRPITSMGGLERHSVYLERYFRMRGYAVEQRDLQHAARHAAGLPLLRLVSAPVGAWRMGRGVDLSRYQYVICQEYTGAFVSHDPRVLCFHHIVHDSLEAVCGARRKSAGARLLDFNVNFMEQRAVRSRRCLAVSNRIRGELQERYASFEDCHVIENAVDTVHFTNRKVERERFQNDAPVVLFAGRNDACWKGMDLVRELINTTGSEFNWLILTDRSFAADPLCDRVNVSVEFEVTYEHLPEIYSEADVACYFSRYEGHSYYLLEMLSMGIPTVAFDAGVSAEIFQDPVLASTYLGARSADPKADRDETLRVLRTLVDDPDYHGRIAKRARELAERRFPLPVWYERLDAILRP